MSLRSRILYPAVTLNTRKTASDLKGKTILLTGATFGIGEALAKHLFQYEVALILVARNKEKLAELRSESLFHAARVTTISCDLYNQESISKLSEELKSVHIDYFISNAGKSLMRTFQESKNRIDDYHRTISVNYLAPVQLITTLSGPFEKAGTHIVNISTYNVLMKTPPMWSAYVSSKKAMLSWFEGNVHELEAKHILVSNIFLPLVESRMKDANKNYSRTPAMSMSSAVHIIVKRLQKRTYHFTPWWHIPFQVFLFFSSPLWNFYWRNHMRKRKDSL